MTGNIIKEIIILLITLLVAMLLFALVFYEFIPSRKIVPEVVEYSETEQVKELLGDDVENRNDQVVLTYKVTGSDLTKSKTKKDYVPGKANPFENSVYATGGNTTSGNGGNSSSSGNSGNSGTSSGSGSTSSESSLK